MDSRISYQSEAGERPGQRQETTSDGAPIRDALASSINNDSDSTTPQYHYTTMHPLNLLLPLGAAFTLLHVSEAFVLRPLPLSPSISRSPCSRAAGTSTTSKRSVAYQDNQHPHKSQQPHANDKGDNALLADLEGKFYQWKHGPVHYVEAGGETAAAEAFPVLLLPGKMSSERESGGMTAM